jgi:hypothetical protein
LTRAAKRGVISGLPHLSLTNGGEQKLVHPLWFDMHIHQKSLLLRVLEGALEGGIDVLLTAVMMK